MKNLREEMIKILKNEAFEGNSLDEQCGFWADKLLSLFKQQMKEIVGEMEKISLNINKNDFKNMLRAEMFCDSRNKLRKELLKNIEEIK